MCYSILDERDRVTGNYDIIKIMLINSPFKFRRELGYFNQVARQRSLQSGLFNKIFA